MEYEKQFQFLKNKFESKKLGHAYVFSGQDVEGLKKFAEDFATFINCKFPDVAIVKSEPDSSEITIKQIRDVQNFLAYKSYNGGYKTVIIENAERMNIEAQNCFLKSLEEPKGDTLIMLLSSKPEMLLPTIFSRCQQLKFSSKAKPNANISLSHDLSSVLDGDLAEKFKYAKAVNLDGGNFENILHVLQNHWRKDIGKYKNVLRLTLDLEHQAQVSNLNKKLALEILLLET